MNSLWIAFFQAFKSLFDFASNLVSPKQPTTSDVDAEAQRAGSAAGAAANHASHIAGEPHVQISKGDHPTQ